MPRWLKSSPRQLRAGKLLTPHSKLSLRKQKTRISIINHSHPVTTQLVLIPVISWRIHPNDLVIPLHPLFNKQAKKAAWYLFKSLGCMNLGNVTFGCNITKNLTSFLNYLSARSLTLSLSSVVLLAPEDLVTAADSCVVISSFQPCVFERLPSNYGAVYQSPNILEASQ